MRIILLSQWYTPEPNSKTHELAKELFNKGHQVTSLTGYPNYPQGHIYPGYKQKLWEREVKDGVQVIRVPLFPDHSYSKLKRALNYLSFAISASFLGPFLCGPADIMWVYHPPLTVGIPAWWIALLRKTPFVYEIHDLWPETLTATGFMPNRFVESIISRLAHFIYKRAAAITVSSPGFKRNLVKKGVPSDKIHITPDWADEDIYRPVPRDNKLAEEHGLTDRFNIMFAGNMGAAQGLQNVIEAADLLSDVPKVQFVFIGDGVDQDSLRKMAQKRKLDNVCFLGRLPEVEMPNFFALADVLLVHLIMDPLFEITIPSKTLAYLASGRPILGVISGDGANLIREANAGVICKQEDPFALAQAIRDLYAMSANQREMMGKAGRREFLSKYSRKRLMEQYEDLFGEISKQNKGSMEK